MVTIWDNHWDQLPHNRTRYTDNFIHVDDANITSGVDTIFVRIYRPNNNKRAWRGTISNIQKAVNETWFDVQLHNEIIIPQNLPNYSSGWYLFNGVIETTNINANQIVKNVIQDSHQNNEIEPPFFQTLRSTRDYRQFESLTPHLLRLIGLNEVYTNPPERQAGLPDGFFKIRNIEVIYDSKLNENYLNDCIQQINNYCNQLTGGSINFGDISITLNPDNDKYVWIITRGQSGYIKTVNNVMVKEVSLDTLIKLFHGRINECFHQKELENHLRTIEDI